jgi:holo-[acyl-carrier protein] synthase
MAILGHGIDLVDIARIDRMLRDHGDHFLLRVYTPDERDYCLPRKRAAEHLAGRFAVKEAVLKVLGTGWRGQIAWTDMDVRKNSDGKPTLLLSGECARIAAGHGITHWHVSISHTDTHAIGSAIGERLP